MKKILFIPVLILAITAVYYQTLHYHFLKGWDDEWQVLNAYTLNGVTFENIREIFSTFYNGQYSPLNQLIYVCIYTINGLNPYGFHFMNLVWHMGFIVLIFLFTGKLLNLYHCKEESSHGWAAFFVALFMALHPVQVEVVAWISASKVLSCSFFFMCSMVCYLAYLQAFQLRYYIGTLLFFICSFLCKEQAIILPVCLVLIDWFIRRKLADISLIIEKAPFFALSFCFLLLTAYSYDSTWTRVISNSDFYTFPQRIAFSGYSLIEYVQKLILPLNLMYIYPFPMDAGDSLPARFWFYPLVIPVIIYVLWYFKKERIFIFGCLFFLVQLSFFLHIVSLPRFAIIANRYLYIASLGFFIPAVWYSLAWIKRIKPNKILISILLVLLFTLQGIYSYQVCKDWNNDRSLKAKMKLLLNERNCNSNNS